MKLSDLDPFIYAPKVPKAALNELWAYIKTLKVENNAPFVLCEQSQQIIKNRSKLKLVQNIIM